MEAIIFTIGLSLVRQYGLNFSWRKMIWIGSVSFGRAAGAPSRPLVFVDELDSDTVSFFLVSQMLVTIFNLMYLLIVYNVIRNPYFYMFTDVTDTFMCKYNTYDTSLSHSV
jgi:hypothetical protein